MKYMLAIYGNKEFWSQYNPEEFDDMVKRHAEWDRETKESGEYLYGAGLEFEEQAKVVRKQNDELVVTDGPYLESKEFIGTFFVLEVATPERAYELAAKLPSAAVQGVEVWPLM